jgi:hypothetical protein
MKSMVRIEGEAASVVRAILAGMDPESLSASSSAFEAEPSPILEIMPSSILDEEVSMPEFFLHRKRERSTATAVAVAVVPLSRPQTKKTKRRASSEDATADAPSPFVFVAKFISSSHEEARLAGLLERFSAMLNPHRNRREDWMKNPPRYAYSLMGFPSFNNDGQ